MKLQLLSCWCKNCALCPFSDKSCISKSTCQYATRRLELTPLKATVHVLSPAQHDLRNRVPYCVSVCSYFTPYSCTVLFKCCLIQILLVHMICFPVAFLFSLHLWKKFFRPRGIISCEHKAACVWMFISDISRGLQSFLSRRRTPWNCYFWY